MSEPVKVLLQIAWHLLNRNSRAKHHKRVRVKKEANMTIRVYNTLTRRKEPFEPIQPGKVTMYVCGPTVYDSCHIGHARSAIVFDVIRRYLEVRGFQVRHVRNFTDIDDKIISRAQELHSDWQTIAEKYIQEFYTDMDALYIRRAVIEPKATGHIGQIVALIERLMLKQVAYEVDGDVYFSVESFDGYGKLSGRKLEDMEAGARIAVDERKKNPFDFALWKSSKPGEPAWESPWGPGRPGWHIECSAMSSEYLGETFDIHGGGKDLIFPHHENEIAQSESAFGVPFANYWIHNGFVNIDQEKMSKSLGNFLLIRDILKACHPEAIRLFLLSNHYRSPIDFTDRAISESATALDKIYTTLARIEGACHNGDVSGAGATGSEWQRFCDAMDDDFNTAQGIGVLFDTIRTSNRLLDENGNRITPESKNAIRQFQFDILKMGQVLGILNTGPDAYFADKKTEALDHKELDETLIEKLIADRLIARKEKDWQKADEIRDQLAEMNVILEDRPDGTHWKVNT